MSETILLLGSLSNDLFRVASLTQRGSNKASERFVKESKRWVVPLLNRDIPTYLKKIISDVAESSSQVDLKKAEKLLMYAVLLQNYSLSLVKSSNKVHSS